MNIFGQPMRMPRRRPTPRPLQPSLASEQASLTLLDVPVGCRAKIGSQPGSSGLGESAPGASTQGLAQLQAYGLQAGYWVFVLQRSPVVVLQIDQLELAMEKELAARVMVEEIAPAI
jgi:Fe2+ transport system protein FeoA